MNFQDVELVWEGKRYTIKASRMMEAIARIEDHITAHELFLFSKRGTIPQGKLSRAFSSLLNMAGVSVSEQEVYFACIKDQNAERVWGLVDTVLAMMNPPEDLREDLSGDKEPGKASPAGAKPSGKRMKSQSVKAG